MPRELHRFIRSRIEMCLQGRPWSWLAKEAGIPPSTLATQRLKPKFSVDVLVAIARVLGRPVTDFLPGEAPPATPPSEEVLAQIKQILEAAGELEGDS